MPILSSMFLTRNVQPCFEVEVFSASTALKTTTRFMMNAQNAPYLLRRTADIPRTVDFTRNQNRAALSIKAAVRAQSKARFAQSKPRCARS
jgi:hypothetical protein